MQRARRLLRSFAAFGNTLGLELEAAFSQLRLAKLERQDLLRPYRRVWRWYRHPLTVAYRDSRRRRKAL